MVAADEGPGIADVERAMQDGYTTGNGLGLGLPGTRRLVDDFELETAPGAGTTDPAGEVDPCLIADSRSWPSALELGIAERALAGECRSGDRAVLVRYEGGALVAAIDGLGPRRRRGRCRGGGGRGAARPPGRRSRRT